MRSRPRWHVPRRWRGGRPRRRVRARARARWASGRQWCRHRRRRRARGRHRRWQRRQTRRLWRSPPSAASWAPPPPTRSCGGDCAPRTAACRPPPTPSLKPHRPLRRRGVVGRREGRERVVPRPAPRARASCGLPSRAGGAVCVSKPRARTPSCRVATSVSAQRAARSSARRRRATRAARSASCRPRASCASSARSNGAKRPENAPRAAPACALCCRVSNVRDARRDRVECAVVRARTCVLFSHMCITAVSINITLQKG